MTVPLPLPDDPRVAYLLEAWPTGLVFGFPLQQFPHPRSIWLKALEVVLREHYPQASSRQLSLTARGAAPFPLRDGPNVP